MNKGLLILGTSLLLAACGQRAGEPVQEKAAHAAAIGQTEAAAEGAITEYYEDGTVRAKYTRTDGQLQGQYLRYRPGGDLESSSFYKDNLLEGTLTLYYESGNRVRSTQE